MPQRHDRFLQSMLDASIHGMMLVIPLRSTDHIVIDFSVIAANSAIGQHVGFTIDDAEQPSLKSIFPNTDQWGFFDLFLESLNSNKPLRKELFYNDNRVAGWFDVGVAPTEGGLVITFVNITDKRQYQVAIEEQASRLKTILDIAQSGIFVFQPVRDDAGNVADFRFSIVNQALASYVGQQAENLTGDLGSKWFPGYKTNGLFDLYRNTYETGLTNRFDFHYDVDGIDVWLDIMSTKFEDSVLVTFTDFTPVKQLQLKLESLVEELKRSNENLEEFAYAASHDLQEPLRKIHFFSNRLKMNFEEVLGAEGASMLERMENAAKRMRVLIDDLLAFSRVSAKRSQFTEVDLNAVIREVTVDLEQVIQDKGAQVQIDSLPTIEGDPIQLRQMFQNLVGNALKYSRPGVVPEVAIEYRLTKGREAGMELPPTESGKNFHLITVSDNGVGFEQEHARRIFQLFQRLHGRAEYEGTGIGLSIVQKVVENHSGHIAAFGEPGVGARFKVLLPVKD